jgi:hypothetical protein
VAALALAAAPPAPALPDPGPLLIPIKRILLRVNSPQCDRVAAINGDDGALGDAGGPFRTVQRLSDSLSAGQTGCLRAGTHDTQEEMFLRTPGITLVSYPNERATIRGRIVVYGQGDKLESLTLDGSCPSGACHEVSPTVSAADVAIVANDITNRHTGICLSPTSNNGQFPQPDRVLIVANRIHNCGVLPPANHDHGVYVADGTGGMIYENVMYDNADRGVQLFPAAQGVTVYHNTIDGNGEGVNIGSRSTGNLITENVITNSTQRWNVEWGADLTGPGNTIMDNCLYGSNGNSFYNGDGGVQNEGRDQVVLLANTVSRSAAIYTNRGAKDFRIPPTSPCFGFGALGPEAGP